MKVLFLMASKSSIVLGVLLAVVGPELYEPEAQALEGPRVEEVLAPVVALEDLLLALGDHGRELVEVAEEDHLHAAEWQSAVPPVEPQEPVDAVEEVGPDHRYLVDHYRVDGPVLPRRVEAELPDRVRGDVGLEAEEGVYRLALHVQRRDPGRGQHGHVLAGRAPEVREEGGLAGPCLAGYEEVPRALHRAEGPAEVPAQLDAGRLLG